MPTAIISVTKPATCYTPCSVVVDGSGSSLDGYEAEDCLFSWDFGDPSPANSGGGRDEVWNALNYKAKTSFPDPRFSTDRDVTSREISRDIHLNTGQTGIIAGYVYYSAAVYTVTLTVTTPAGSNSTTATVTVVAGGTSAGWTNKTVNPLGGGDYTTLAAAVAWLNGHGSQGVITLAATTHRVDTPLVITATESRIVSASNTDYAIIATSSTWSSSSALLKFSGQDVYIENIYFNQDKNSLSTAQAIGIEVASSYVGIHRCYFNTFYNGIKVSSGSGLNISQCYVYRSRSHGIYVLAGSLQAISGIWSYSSDSSLTSLEGDIVHFGTASSKWALQWNYLKYNGTLSFNATSDTYPQNDSRNTNKGPIGVEGMSYGNILANVGLGGTNCLGTSTQTSSIVKLNGNVFTAGGENAIIDFCGNVNHVSVVNNVLDVGRGGPHSVAIYGYGTGTLSSVKITNNTFVLSDNIRITQGIVNFSANGRTIGANAILFQNNLFVDNRHFFSHYIVCDNINIFGTNIGYNCYPVRRDEVDCLKVSSTEYDWTEFQSSGFTTGDVRVTLPYIDMCKSFEYIADKSLYPSLQSGKVQSSMVIPDMRGTSRSLLASNWTIGAVESPATPFPDDNGDSWTCVFHSTARTDRSDGALPSGVDGYNGYITVTDGSNSFALMGGSGAGTTTPFFTTTDPTVANRIGSNIKTEIRFTSADNGFDVSVTYTNDNGSGQTASSQNIGAFRFISWDLGRFLRVMDNTVFSDWREFDNFTGNIFNLAVWSYPYDKFSPNTVIGGRDYSIGISVLSDFVGNDRRYTELLSSYGDPAKNSLDTTFRWTAGATGNQNRLLPGESFEATFSVRISRAPKTWITTLEPYKTYFAENHGSVAYAQDPRPIVGFVPVQTASLTTDNRFGYNNFVQTDSEGRTTKFIRPDHYGWSTWAENIIKVHTYNGFDRFLMWSLSGVYKNNLDLNYPQRMFSPFYISSTPQNDAIINPSNLATDTRGYTITYPLDVPSGTARPMVDTLSELSHLTFDVPSMGFYFGRVGFIDDLQWDSGVTRLPTYSNSSDVQLVLDEIDIGVAKLKGNYIGLDAFGFDNLSNDLDFINTLNERHPHTGYPLAELQNSDITSRITAGYTNNRAGSTWTHAPSEIGHYVIPGMDLVCSCRFDFYYSKIGGFSVINDDHKLCIMENMAQLGYSLIIFADIYLDTPSRYNAANIRFNYSTPPADYPTLAAPSNLRKILYDNLVNSTYSCRNIYSVISWDANTEPDFDHYVVYKAKVIDGESSPDSGYVTRMYTKKTSYYDNAVEDGKTYHYKIKAVDVFGNESSFSEVLAVDFVSDDSSLPAPSNVRRDTTGGLGSLVIAWSE